MEKVEKEEKHFTLAIEKLKEQLEEKRMKNSKKNC